MCMLSTTSIQSLFCNYVGRSQELQHYHLFPPLPSPPLPSPPLPSPPLPSPPLPSPPLPYPTLPIPQSALHTTSPSVWLPYSALDHLQQALKDAPSDSTLAEVNFSHICTLTVLKNSSLVVRLSPDTRLQNTL